MHYHTKLYGGGRFSFLEASKGNRLQSKVTVNSGITEAVVLPASDNLFTETGTLERPPRLIDRKKTKKKSMSPLASPFPSPPANLFSAQYPDLAPPCRTQEQGHRLPLSPDPGAAGLLFAGSVSVVARSALGKLDPPDLGAPRRASSYPPLGSTDRSPAARSGHLLVGSAADRATGAFLHWIRRRSSRGRVPPPD
jgi:hypothetical protein